eukprot:CFRG0214T1
MPSLTIGKASESNTAANLNYKLKTSADSKINCMNAADEKVNFLYTSHIGGTVTDGRLIMCHADKMCQRDVGDDNIQNGPSLVRNNNSVYSTTLEKDGFVKSDVIMNTPSSMEHLTDKRRAFICGQSVPELGVKNNARIICTGNHAVDAKEKRGRNRACTDIDNSLKRKTVSFHMNSCEIRKPSSSLSSKTGNSKIRSSLKSAVVGESGVAEKISVYDDANAGTVGMCPEKNGSKIVKENSNVESLRSASGAVPPPANEEISKLTYDCSNDTYTSMNENSTQHCNMNQYNEQFPIEQVDSTLKTLIEGNEKATDLGEEIGRTTDENIVVPEANSSSSADVPDSGDCEGSDLDTESNGWRDRVASYFRDYSRVRCICLTFYLTLWFPSCLFVYASCYIVSAVSLTNRWSNYDVLVRYLAVLACLCCLAVSSTAIYYLYKFRGKPLMKSRGRRFVVHMFGLGIIPCTILSLIEVLMTTDLRDLPSGVSYVLYILQNFSLNQFVIAIVARQRMIYRIFNSSNYNITYSYELFAAAVTVLWGLSIIPFSVSFWIDVKNPPSVINPSQSNFTYMWMGAVAQTLVYWALFVYYSWNSRAAHEKFSDYYQNVRLAILTPALFLTFFIASSFYKYSAYSILVVPYLCWFVITLYVLDTFAISIYITVTGADYRLEVAKDYIPGSAVARCNYLRNTLCAGDALRTSSNISSDRRGTSLAQDSVDDGSVLGRTQTV